MNFLLQIGKKILQLQLFFFGKLLFDFFFQINLQNFCFVMMTKKEAFAGGIRSSQSTVFKNLKKVKKNWLTKGIITEKRNASHSLRCPVLEI